MFLVIASRFKNLRGAKGTRWFWTCLALFPVCFLLGFLHPLVWAAATVALEVYIITSCIREWKLRTRTIAERSKEADALRARAEQGVL